MTHLLCLTIGLCVGWLIGYLTERPERIVMRTRLTLWLVHTDQHGERLLRIECDDSRWPVPERVLVGRLVERGATDAEVRAVRRMRRAVG